MKTTTVLMIEDDADLAARVKECLEPGGAYQVVCENGRMAGRDLVERHGAEIVLLDVDTADAEVGTLLSAMRPNAAQTEWPIIVLSGNDSPQLKSRSLELGADDYITKPFHHDELAARVNAVLRRSRRSRPADGAMRGVLAEVPLPILIQTLALNNRTATINLPDDSARILYRDGLLIGASFHTFAGVDALTRLVLGATGRFEIEFDRVPVDAAPLGRRTEPLLLEIVQQVDELATAIQPVPTLDTLLELDFAQEVPDGMIESFARWQPISARRLLTLMPGFLRENALMIGLLYGLGTLVQSNRKP